MRLPRPTVVRDGVRRVAPHDPVADALRVDRSHPVRDGARPRGLASPSRERSGTGPPWAPGHGYAGHPAAAGQSWPQPEPPYARRHGWHAGDAGRRCRRSRPPSTPSARSTSSPNANGLPRRARCWAAAGRTAVCSAPWRSSTRSAGPHRARGGHDGRDSSRRVSRQARDAALNPSCGSPRRAQSAAD